MDVFRVWEPARETVRRPDGRSFELTAWGWAHDSLQEARDRARERLALAAARIRAGDRLDEYDYSRAPMREDVLDELVVDGETVAVVTRNRYGALVLSTAHTLIADVDLPSPPTGARRWVGRVRRFLAGRGGDEEAPTSDAERALDRIRTWFDEHPRHGGRIYRTPAGFRVLVPGGRIAPLSDEAEEILTAFGSDALYLDLCQRHDCYRARLTPKPWRIGVPRPRDRWPHRSEDAQGRHRAWVSTYDRARASWAACELVEELGDGSATPSDIGIVTLHDTLACSAGAALA